jgi:hypothetical protein
MADPKDLDPEYLAAAQGVGFTPEQAAFLEETFAFDPHTHSADQIFVDEKETQTLDEVLEDI